MKSAPIRRLQATRRDVGESASSAPMEWWSSTQFRVQHEYERARLNEMTQRRKYLDGNPEFYMTFVSQRACTLWHKDQFFFLSKTNELEKANAASYYGQSSDRSDA